MEPASRIVYEGGFNTTPQVINTVAQPVHPPDSYPKTIIVPNTAELDRGIKPKLTYAQAYWNCVNAPNLQESWEALDAMKELVTLDQTYSSQSGSWMPDSSNPLVPKPKGWTVQNADLFDDKHDDIVVNVRDKINVAMGMFFGAFVVVITFSVLLSLGIIH